MTITTHTNDRKALAKAIAEELGTTAVYMRTPTYAYQIGDFTLDRYGNLIGEDFSPLNDFLWRNGFIGDETETEQEAAAVTEPAIEPEAAEETEAAAEEETDAEPEEAPTEPETADEQDFAEDQKISATETPGDTEEAEEHPAKEEQAQTEEPAALPDGEPADDSEAEPANSMGISIPAKNVTLAQLKNLTFMLFSRQTLINRMTQGDCLNVPNILIECLKESTPETPEAFTEMLDDAKAVAGLTGFDFRDGKVTLTFPYDETQPERWSAYANLLNRMYDAAMKATRVIPERVEPDEQNEKYLAHIWLQRLGYSGPNFKAERKILLGHLNGYCAFATGDKMQAHKDKYAAIYRERRAAEREAAAAQEAAVTEVAAEAPVSEAAIEDAHLETIPKGAETK